MVIPDWTRVTYQAMAEAYGEGTRDLLRPSVAADPELLIANAARQVLPETDGVDLFLDCRSSPAVGVANPTYRACSLIGLVDVPPLSISGGGGTEFALALLALNGTAKLGINRALVALTSYDATKRRSRTRAHHGTGSVAVVVTNEQGPSSPIRVLAVIVMRRSPRSALGAVARAALDLENLGVTTASLRWAIVTPRLNALATAIQRSLPGAELHGRAGERGVDYGCADGLVSLSELLRRKGIPPGPGILWLAGYGRQIAAVVVEVPGATVLDRPDPPTAFTSDLRNPMHRT
jgi:hypothetical protein